MSLRIIKAGILDTIQDMGRFGYQHHGINPGGAMDRFSCGLANALLGKEISAAVFEFHFPASEIYFEKETIITLTGADLSPAINQKPVPMYHPIAIAEGSILKFTRIVTGARAYMAVLGDLELEKWLGSYSTNLKTTVGGFNGRSFLRYDGISFRYIKEIKTLLNEKDFMVLPWKVMDIIEHGNQVQCIIGNEWHYLDKDMQQEFQNSYYQITTEADRMGYILAGARLKLNTDEQMTSSAASFGTIQLLPGGQLILLMADHQTTGGYPRIAHVISADLPIVAQKKPNDVLQFQLTDLTTAEEKFEKQQKYLNEIQIACKFRMQNTLHADM
jgi:antagonist of KipI